MGRRGFGVLKSGEHPSDLSAAVFTFDNPNRGRRYLACRRLLHDEVVVGERGDLRKVRDNKNLRSARQSCKTTPHFNSGPTTDTGIYLIKNQRACRFGTGDRNL